MNHGEPPILICSAPYANSLVSALPHIYSLVSAQTPNSYWHDSLARLFDPLFFTVKPLKSPILVAKLSHCWLAKIRRIVW